MKKIVINNRYGGFGLSDEAIKMYNQLTGLKIIKFSYRNISRDDPNLVKIVETLGPKSNGKYADLKIVQIPEDVDWEIQEYDGTEWIAEKHRTWHYNSECDKE